jgi:hypothetical protein
MNEQFTALVKLLNDIKDTDKTVINFEDNGIKLQELDKDGNVTAHFFVKLRYVNEDNVEVAKFVARDQKELVPRECTDGC